MDFFELGSLSLDARKIKASFAAVSRPIVVGNIFENSLIFDSNLNNWERKRIENKTFIDLCVEKEESACVTKNIAFDAN